MDNKILVARYQIRISKLLRKLVMLLTGWDTDVLPWIEFAVWIYTLQSYGQRSIHRQLAQRCSEVPGINEKCFDRPVWLFSSGPTGEGDPVELLKGWRLPAGLQPIADRIQPRGIAVFHGRVNMEKLNLSKEN
jgi:hypothetical protein